MEVFQDYAYYYNAFYQDKDYKAEAKQIDLLLQKYGQNIKKIINYGCGTGRHDIELSKLGYHCTGIDLSPLMIDMRYFFRPELEYYLKQTGFELIDHVDCSTLGETDFTSWTSYFVAKAV